MQLPPLPDAPDVAIVIPARDAAATLGRAVASALAQEVPAGRHVVVAAAPSTDGTRELADELAAAHADVEVVDNPAGTTPAGLNAAIDASRGEVVVRLDAHAELPDGYVARAVATLRRTGAANVGGRQVPTAGGEGGAGGFAAAAAAAMRSPVGAGGATYRVGGDAGPVDTVYLGVFPRAALEAVGGFDEAFASNQDYELNHRLRAAGGTVWFDPELAVAYRPRASLGALARQYLRYGAWKRRTLRAHPGSLRLRQLAAPALVLALAGGVVLAAAAGVWWPLAAVAAAELAVVLAGAAAAARPRLVPATAVALLTMHLAWGVGLLAWPARTPSEPGYDRPRR